MKYAWIENGKVRDVAQGDPSKIYHPSVAAHYTTQVPDGAAHGDGWVNGQLVKPTVVSPDSTARKWTEQDFRSGLSLAEKTKWDNNSSPEIITVKQELPKELAGATELLTFLVGAGVISQESKNKILA